MGALRPQFTWLSNGEKKSTWLSNGTGKSKLFPRLFARDPTFFNTSVLVVVLEMEMKLFENICKWWSMVRQWRGAKKWRWTNSKLWSNSLFVVAFPNPLPPFLVSVFLPPGRYQVDHPHFLNPHHHYHHWKSCDKNAKRPRLSQFSHLRPSVLHIIILW